jgi:ABC-type oligopeptide transport system substrate-binding subunit
MKGGKMKKSLFVFAVLVVLLSIPLALSAQTAATAPANEISRSNFQPLYHRIILDTIEEYMNSSLFGKFVTNRAILAEIRYALRNR